MSTKLDDFYSQFLQDTEARVELNFRGREVSNWDEWDRLVEEERRESGGYPMTADEHKAGRRARLRKFGVPQKDVDRVVDETLDDTPALGIVRENASSLLVLSGKPGCGKTTAAAWWLSLRNSGRFVTAQELERTSRYDDDAIRLLWTVPALVLDDLGTEYLDAKNAFVSLFDGLVNARYANVLPTLITTNLDAEEFKQRYGERVVDRIRESGRFAQTAGDSLRRRKS